MRYYLALCAAGCFLLQGGLRLAAPLLFHVKVETRRVAFTIVHASYSAAVSSSHKNSLSRPPLPS